MNSTYYAPLYENSFALVVGINSYVNASPLGYAVNDAEAVATLLKDEFDFKSENIKLLLNESATRNEIMALSCLMLIVISHLTIEYLYFLLAME
jgi:hypothetical protein